MGYLKHQILVIWDSYLLTFLLRPE